MVNTDVSNLVRNEQCPLRRFADVMGEDCAALVVENGARTFQYRVALREPCKIDLKMRERGRYQLHRLLERGTSLVEREVKSRGGLSNRLKGVHASFAK
jgi:hypothetical protein